MEKEDSGKVIIMGFGTGRAKPKAKPKVPAPGAVDSTAALKALASHDHWAVRGAAADAGCALDVLLADENPYVSRRAAAYLARNSLTLVDWMEANPGLVAGEAGRRA